MNSKGCPSCIKTTSIPLPEAPHSKTKILDKPSTTRTQVDNMASFKVEKVCLAASLHTKAFFFSSDVKRVAFFP